MKKILGLIILSSLFTFGASASADTAGLPADKIYLKYGEELPEYGEELPEY
ncbi:hypothetical protein M4D56_20300 [Cytobacillus oceanisediminis]|nr:hypothetical protein [Cytobacillus oceanisediminis]MBY0156703.1 hypothetical protein [Cytobacillus firmus]MCM3242116.1 hypothetical protein [Cytobacillus oceanisediminis]MCM3391201.1 hypothetical protein [Cytobacillus oceanisediminis]MCM3531428.1 hypothetical protein [Cytobacillus oceanisediminis]